MNLEKKILFLGPSNSIIFTWLKNNGENIISFTDKITINFILENNFTFLISYGYRFILKKEILDLFPNSAVNLHISYLPYNRGADPNFWSFIDGTPSGVSIHYIDEGIDTGDIIVQKQIIFNSYDFMTLASTYEKLHFEIQQLFIQHWDTIKNKTCNRFPQVGCGTSHNINDKKKIEHILKENGWNTKLSILLKFKSNLEKS